MAKHADSTITPIAHPDPRTIRRALGVLERLPHEALFDLAERLIERLDDAELDPDLEPEEDRCEADDGGGSAGDKLAGEADDAEHSPVLPRPRRAPRVFSERDAIVCARRRPIVVVRYEHGLPVRARMMTVEQAR